MGSTKNTGVKGDLLVSPSSPFPLLPTFYLRGKRAADISGYDTPTQDTKDKLYKKVQDMHFSLCHGKPIRFFILYGQSDRLERFQHLLSSGLMLKRLSREVLIKSDV